MAVPLLGAHTAAIVSALAETGYAIGDGRRPDGGGWQGAEGRSDFRLYAIVWRLTPQHDGPIVRGNDDLEGEWQVTSVGPTAAAAEKVADACRQALLDPETRTLTVPDRGVLRVAYEGGAGITRDDEDKPPLFYAVDRYRIATTPA